MYKEPEVTSLINLHTSRANATVLLANSKLVRNAYAKIWGFIDSGSITELAGTMIMFDFSDLKAEVDQYISDLDELRLKSENKKLQLKGDQIEEELLKLTNIISQCQEISLYYNMLKSEISEIELDFENAVRYYRSPMRQGLNDISIIYNSMKNIKGPMGDFEEVSVYIHGIESNGNEFLESAKKASVEGDVIVHVKRNGKKEYYVVKMNEYGEKEVLALDDFQSLQKEDAFKYPEGRIHLVYDTEQSNEHRQETSDDLTRLLSEMGLINKTTKLNLFGHSYGGRRSMQFAMDYPDYVQSITTIGTPYDKNKLAKTGNSLPYVAGKIGQDPRQFTDFLDFNPENKREDNGILHSNVYTDLSKEEMKEDLQNLKSANPEVYTKLEKMNIIASAGYRMETVYYEGGSMEVKTESDDVVSLESQNANNLESLIDERPQYEVEGVSTIKNPGHGNEIKDEEFIELIRQVNTDK
ncbi:alpha/beta fold hydrolase [Peribacillus sp. NPDC097264]|uniref:alpha/beta fold hydrolase n=1 Tax=Peribacillus sp. NPDC097264 TaxID=3390616 RepID=UPI003CFE784F